LLYKNIIEENWEKFSFSFNSSVAYNKLCHCLQHSAL
jgi:hypothetical protein